MNFVKNVYYLVITSNTQGSYITLSNGNTQEVSSFSIPMWLTIYCSMLIGMGTIILPGVTIGEGAIIGAGSIVTRDIPAWSIAAGNPAKVLKIIPERNNKSSI